MISGSLTRKKLKVTNHKNGTNSTGYSSHLLDHKDTGLQPESYDTAGHQHVSAGQWQKVSKVQVLFGVSVNISSILRRILIDTGDENVPQYIEHLNGVLKQEQATIGTIILTHWHHDHVGGVKDIVGSTLAEKGEC